MSKAKSKLIERYNIAVTKLNCLDRLDNQLEMYDRLPVDYSGKVNKDDVEYMEKHFKEMAITIGKIRAIESKQWSDDLLEMNWIESSDEYCVNRGSYIIVDGLEEQEAYDLLDEFKAECDE